MSENLKHGEEMEISRRVYRFEPKDIAALTALPVEELQARREKSAAAETAIFDKLCADAGAWEAQASETLLIDMAIEYAKTRAVEHTGNKWQPDSYGRGQEISNTVFKMYHHVYEDTKYDRDTKQSVPVAWYLTWAVRTQAANGGRYTGDVAGQDRKRFTDKAVMEKYLQGRIKAYAHLFTELSPPVPKEFERYFTVNGQLLPGYRVEGQEPKPSGLAADQRQGGAPLPEKRESAMGKLAAAKEAVAKGGAEKPSPDRTAEKPRGPEL
jgi:hypothetical protein